jgi:hypothetical protein
MARARKAKIKDGSLLIAKGEVTGHKGGWVCFKMFGVDFFAEEESITREQGDLVVTECQTEVPDELCDDPRPGDEMVGGGIIDTVGISRDGVNVDMPSWIAFNQWGMVFFTHKDYIHRSFAEPDKWSASYAFGELPAVDEVAEG